MEHVLGIGGYFVRAADRTALTAWHRDCLGLEADENGLWTPEARVRDLDAMPAQLRATGTAAAEEPQEMAEEPQETEGIGRFGLVTDPEGNRIELWQAV